MRALWLFRITACLLASCGGDPPPLLQSRPLFPEPAPREDCEDGLDNDDDFLIDCEDEACLEALPCLPPACDSPDECQDPACQAAHVCYEHLCGDGLDNDGDGLTDCVDLDCVHFLSCHKEDCPRWVDTGAVVDCQRSACAGAVGCGAPRGDGEPCLDGSGCRSGRCLTEQETGYPGGMCASACDLETPCPEGGVCLDGTCLPACAQTEDCRPGYSCFEAITGHGDPRPSAESEPSSGDGRQALAPVCVPDCMRDAECPWTGQCEWFSGRCGERAHFVTGEGREVRSEKEQGERKGREISEAFLEHNQENTPLASGLSFLTPLPSFLALRDGARCASGEECAGGRCDPEGYCTSLCAPSRQSCPPGEECEALSGSVRELADVGFCREELLDEDPLPWEDEELLSKLGDPPLSLGVSYPDPHPSDESDPLFTLDYVHKVSLFVTEEERSRLRLGEKEWARAKLVYDGHILEEVGLRLKGGYGSGDELSGKPGFSVKLNAFQKGQKLYGQKKIILNNARQDPSFLSEHLAYWLYAREGIPASRTAFATVSLNEEPYGLYVVVEAKDEGFFEHRGLPNGPLYEGSYGADLDDIASLEEHSTRKHRGKEALWAFSQLLQSVPDGALLARLSPVVHLEAFVTLWAIEALYYHWDGYLYQANNYYLYQNPKDGRFLFLPHGADQLFHDATTRLDAYPMGFLAARLADSGQVKGMFLKEARRLLGDASLDDAFRARVDQALGLIESAARADLRRPYSEEERRRASAWVREFVPRRRGFLRAALGLYR